MAEFQNSMQLGAGLPETLILTACLFFWILYQMLKRHLDGDINLKDGFSFEEARRVFMFGFTFVLFIVAAFSLYYTCKY